MSAMVIKNGLNLFTAFVISLVNLFVLLVLVWACFHGLDLSDESFYYLGYLFYDNDPSLHPESFHMVYDRFFGWGNFTITRVRLLRLLLSVLVSVVLYLAAKAILRPKGLSMKIVLLNVVLSGMLLSYSWAPQALSYNSMSSIVIALIVALFGFFLMAKSLHIKLLWSFWLGGLFVVLFFIKITNVLLLPLLISIIFYLNGRKYHFSITKKHYLLSALSFILGVFTFLFFISAGDIFIVVQYVRESLGLASSDETHSITFLLNKYYENAKMVVLQLKYYLVALAILFFLLHFFWKKLKISVRLKGATLFKILGILILIFLVIQNDYWKGGTKVVYTMLIVYVYIGTLVLLNSILERAPIIYSITFWLLLVPFVGALGTNNGLSAQVLFYGVFFFLTIYYFILSSETSVYRFFMLTSLVSLASSQIIISVIVYPYRQSNLTESKNVLKGVPAIASLQVDDTLKKLREELTFLEKIDASYIFTYSAQRGSVLLANKKPYSLEWFNANAQQKMCEVFAKSKTRPDDIVFLIPSPAPLQQNVLHCMNTAGIFFEENYLLVKSFEYYDYYYRKETLMNVYVPVSTNK